MYHCNKDVLKKHKEEERKKMEAGREVSRGSNKWYRGRGVLEEEEDT